MPKKTRSPKTSFTDKNLQLKNNIIIWSNALSKKFNDEK